MLGEFEYLLITAAARLGDEAYGAAIREEIASDYRAEVARSVRSTQRWTGLETKGLLKTWMGEATAQRGGRAKRMVRVTPKGVQAAKEFYERGETRQPGRSVGDRRRLMTRSGLGAGGLCFASAGALLNAKQSWAIWWKPARAAGELCLVSSGLVIRRQADALEELAAVAGGVRPGVARQLSSDGIFCSRSVTAISEWIGPSFSERPG